MGRSLTFLFLVLGVQAATAAPKANEVLQIDVDAGRAVIRTSKAGVNAGTKFIATSKDGRQCSLTVESIEGSKAVVDTSRCSFAADLRVGQSLEKSLIDSGSNRATNSSASASTGNGMRNAQSTARLSEMMVVKPLHQLSGMMLFGYYNLADKVSGNVSANNTTTGITVNSDAAFGVGGSYAQMDYRTLGFFAEGGYEFGRDWTSANAGRGNQTLSPKPSLTMMTVAGGANFMVNDNVYLMGGPNYNFPSLSQGGAMSSIGGRLGFQGGIGVRFAGQFEAQLIYRQLGLKVSGNDQGTGFSADDLTLKGVMVRTGYMF